MAKGKPFPKKAGVLTNKEMGQTHATKQSFFIFGVGGNFEKVSIQEVQNSN